MILTMTLVLGAMLWLTSFGGGSHPAYRLVVMLSVLSWLAWSVRTPKTR